MKWIWTSIAKLIVAYGRFGGRLPSVHGSFEPTIPDVLKRLG